MTSEITLPNLTRNRTERLSYRVRWSVLAAIGTAPLVRLTILVPVLGALLLFNETVFSVLQSANEFLADIGVQTADARSYSLNQFYFLYIGLSLVGVASLVFAIVCPEEIRRHPTRMQFVSSTDVSENPVIVTSQLDRVLGLYMDRHEMDGDVKKGKAVEFPIATAQEFESLIGEMFKRTPDSVKGDPNEEHPLNDQIYAGAAMYPNIHGIAHLVWSNPKVVWAFSQPFRALAPDFARDIAFVLYGILDLQKLRYRLIVGTLYLMGFVLVAIPTITTFVRVTLALFRP